jgi:hypothetical protein
MAAKGIFLPSVPHVTARWVRERVVRITAK